MAYGFEVLRADGSVQISTESTVLRHIATEAFEGGETAVRSVPDFDDTRGVIQFTLIPRWQGGVPYMRPDYFPTLTWDNTAKTLSVSSVPAANDYTVSFYHYG